MGFYESNSYYRIMATPFKVQWLRSLLTRFIKKKKKNNNSNNKAKKKQYPITYKLQRDVETFKFYSMMR